MQNELNIMRRIKFESKTYLLQDLSETLLSLNKSVQYAIKKLNKGVEYNELIILFMEIVTALKDVNKYLDAEVVTVNKETGKKYKIVVKTLDSAFVYSIADDIVDMIEKYDKEFIEEKMNINANKIFGKLATVFKDYHNVFEEYKKEALEVGYINQEIMDKVYKKYNC